MIRIKMQITHNKNKKRSTFNEPGVTPPPPLDRYVVVPDVWRRARFRSGLRGARRLGGTVPQDGSRRERLCLRGRVRRHI